MIKIYFYTLKETARKFSFLKNFILLKEFINTSKGFIRFKLELKDGSEIHVFEYVKTPKEVIDYSYHWQDKDKNLVMRWDNAPHHPELNNSPYHVHIKEQIKSSRKLTFNEVLEIVEECS